METLTNNFIEYLHIEKGRASSTVDSYSHHLDVFFTQAKINNPQQITSDKVQKFRVFLSTQSYNKRTQNYHLIVLRAFLKFLAKRGIASLNADTIELAKVADREVSIITSNELDRLIAATDKQSDLHKRYRDKAILEMLFSTGLRVSELCGLPSSIDLENDELSVRGKGGKVRVVFLSGNAKLAVSQYLTNRKETSNKLFKLDRRSIARIINQYAEIAKITKKVTPHVMRHVFATNLLSNGADIRSVQAMLGHKNISTTQIYTHVTDKYLREQHQKYHGRMSIDKII